MTLIWRSSRALIQGQFNTAVRITRRNSLQAFTCDEQMRLGHSEDVVYGSGCQDLSHGLIDDISVLCGLHLHAAQEPNDIKLVQDRVWNNTRDSVWLNGNIKTKLMFLIKVSRLVHDFIILHQNALTFSAFCWCNQSQMGGENYMN